MIRRRWYQMWWGSWYRIQGRRRNKVGGGNKEVDWEQGIAIKEDRGSDWEDDGIGPCIEGIVQGRKNKGVET